MSFIGYWAVMCQGLRDERGDWDYDYYVEFCPTEEDTTSDCDLHVFIHGWFPTEISAIRHMMDMILFKREIND